MALIICPECGGKISDKASACIHCGFPLSAMKQNKESSSPPVSSNLTDEIIPFRITTIEKPTFLNASNIIGLLDSIFKDKSENFSARMKSPPCIVVDGISEENALFLEELLRKNQCNSIVEKSNKPFSDKYNDAVSKYRKLYKAIYEEKPTVTDTALRCPKCHSTAITTGARGFNFIWGPIGASKTVNRCANCGNTWSPKK